MRRNIYIVFTVLLSVVGLVFLLFNSFLWFCGLLIPFGVLWFYDVTQKKRTILRNFPILGHIRYILEFIRPEIQQYFIADDHSELPFNREIRSVIYQRAKNIQDTIPFGTEQDILKPGYEWVLHSLAPKKVLEITSRVSVGGDKCKQPYVASRLNISAMSFGALSKNAILALNKGAKLGGFAHNTGEGGLSDYHLEGGGDLVWQIGTGYFGCRASDGNFDLDLFTQKAGLENVKMIEIKLSQGAKPSHGGILPAAKLTKEIAEIRGVPMHQDVISPPAHSAFSTPLGLLKFVETLRTATKGKPVGFKLCIGNRKEFLGICKAMLESKILPDFITVDGAEGGTGAAPLEYTNRVGTPLNDALSFVHNALIGINLRKKIRIISSGKIATGFDLISKLAIGADMCNSARAMMMALGCIQSRQCNTNACPTGVTTQNARLIKGLSVTDKKVRVAQYHAATIHSFLELLGAMGFENPEELLPSHVMRRISVHNIQNYSQIYNNLNDGDLLGKPETLPENFAQDWLAASAKKF
ncbi:MAG: FMN-binding glutamate synthase family protein [Thiotrichales bacterium]|nr:MAG: FMN-binding glutamate synthase family protein [Thiotrichales bacterium]